jgi:hemolysin activation/secretion protein
MVMFSRRTRAANCTPLLLAITAALASAATFAQHAPNAGQLLQQQRPPLALPEAARGPDIEAPAAAAVDSGGARFTLASLSLEGNTAFTEDELLAVLGDYAGKEYDLAQLHQLTERLTQHYRAAGYPFARALLPAQRSSSGHIRIMIVEGRYGRVQARSGEERIARGAEAYLARLQPGTLIERAALERATSLLEDLPGIAVTATMRPGDAVGTGDLVVDLANEAPFRSDVLLDNHGNRYSGQYRAGAILTWSSPFSFGDQLRVQGMLSDEDLRVASIGYSAPLGAHGLRTHFAWGYTNYELGDEFAILGATGRARVASAGLSYPFVRSRNVGLSAQVSYQHKLLEDRYTDLAWIERKHSHVLPVGIDFYHRSASGVTYGAATWTHGKLHLGAQMREIDRVTGRTDGEFDKVHVELARLQQLTGAVSVYATARAQWAADNLDSSEAFGLGGPTGVRAYPSGEAFGDEGWMTQLELRYALGQWTPYAFYDHGEIHVNAKPNATVERRIERRSGAGLGVRLLSAQWRIEAALAWRTSGTKPTSDSRDAQPRPWLSVSRNF